MANRRVVVTGLGVVTPIGTSVEEYWQNLLAGKSGISPITAFDPGLFDSRIAGQINDFDPSEYISPKELKRMERFVLFAVYASHTALKDSGIEVEKEDPYRLGVLVGSGIGALGCIEKQHSVMLERGPGRISPFLIPMMIVNMAPGQIGISLGMKGPNSCVATACASGNHAIGDAFRIVQRGEADVMIAGGTESCITELGIGGFCALKALSTRNEEPQRASRPFDRDRDGFVMGEGSGIVVLEEYERAAARGARIYAEIAGYGLTGDAYNMTAPSPDGEGAARAMELALSSAGVNAQDVQYINAHGTSTALNDKTETLAIKRVFADHAKKLMVNSTKSMTGHLLGAAGGVESVATTLSLYHGKIHGTMNYETPDPDCDLDYVPNEAREVQVKVAMTNSLGFGGHNASLLFKKI
ncbi:MAG: beta-ketoacyl-ACP synthase II [Candidatus Omnitrophica bacterium]|nr:beta-ketoacyl-ACP synthase II [Candidatus Omnitrophota bacterium]